MIHLKQGENNPLTVSDMDISDACISLRDASGHEVATGIVDKGYPADRFFMDTTAVAPGTYDIRFEFPDGNIYYPDRVTVHPPLEQ